MIHELDVVRVVQLSETVRPDYAVGLMGEPRVGDTAAVVFASPPSDDGAQALVLENVSETGETLWLSEASSKDVTVIWRAPNAT